MSLQTQDYPLSSRTLQLQTTAGNTFTALQIAACQEGKVTVAGRVVTGVLVTAGHCVMEDWEGRWRQILPVQPYTAIEILAVPSVETVLEDPVSGLEITLNRPLALLLAYGTAPLPPSSPVWSHHLPPVFSSAIVGTPHYDLAMNLFPGFVHHSLPAQSILSEQLYTEVYRNFGSRLVGRGVGIYRNNTIAVYASAATGMTGAPIFEVSEGTDRLAGVLICGQIGENYANLIEIVRNLDNGRVFEARKLLRKLRLQNPELANILPQSVSNLGKLNAAISQIRSRNRSSGGYNIGIAVNSPAFVSIRDLSQRISKLTGAFQSLSSLRAAV